MDEILQSYHETLQRYAVPFDPIADPDSWHLTLFVMESHRPETVFDIDCRPSASLIHRCRLYPSLWSAMLRAREHTGQIASVEVERACERLPSGSAIHALVENEAIFRLCDGDVIGLDGSTFVAVLATYNCTPLRRTCWRPSDLTGTGWLQLIAAVDDAAKLLPPSRWY